MARAQKNGGPQCAARSCFHDSRSLARTIESYWELAFDLWRRVDVVLSFSDWVMVAGWQLLSRPPWFVAFVKSPRGAASLLLRRSSFLDIMKKPAATQHQIAHHNHHLGRKQQQQQHQGHQRWKKEAAVNNRWHCRVFSHKRRTLRYVTLLTILVVLYCSLSFPDQIYLPEEWRWWQHHY